MSNKIKHNGVVDGVEEGCVRYEIVPGFVCGLIAIFVVSLLTAAPSKEITDEFDSYRSCEE